MTRPRLPRRRAQAPKVRTGCTTCKKRKVKCDEYKPAPCLVCCRLGLRCKYVDAIPSGLLQWALTLKQTPSGSQRFLLPAPTGALESLNLHNMSFLKLDPQEALYFDHYRLRIAARLPHAEFWARTIVRESTTDETVCHCVIALGALSQAIQLGRRRDSRCGVDNFDYNNIRVNYLAAAKHYVKAISTLRNRLADNKAMTPRSLLITNFLFIMYERIQGHCSNADNLMIDCILLLQGHLGVFGNYQSQSRIAAAIDDQGIREAEYLLPRMAAHNAFGARLPKLEAFIQTVITQEMQAANPDESTPLEELLVKWDVWLSRLFLWAYRSAPLWAARDDIAIARVHAVLDILLQKAAVWNRLIADRLKTEKDQTKWPILRVLEVGLRVCLMFIFSFLDKTELSWDGYTSEAQEALGLVELVLSTTEHAENTDSSMPLYDDKLIIMVQIIAERCRDKAVRQHAISTLRRFPMSNLVWDVESHIIGAEVIAQVEEEGRDKNGIIPSERRYTWTGCMWNDNRTVLTVMLSGTVRDEYGNLIQKHVAARPRDFGLVDDRQHTE